MSLFFPNPPLPRKSKAIGLQSVLNHPKDT